LQATGQGIWMGELFENEGELGSSSYEHEDYDNTSNQVFRDVEPVACRMAW
jgi:hypothetical protein